jgi:hypothetical protein
MRYLLLTLTFVTMLAACKKDNSADGEMLPDFVKCNLGQNLDSAALAVKLIGTWRTIQQRAPYSVEFVAADKNITATFKSDLSFTVTQNANVIQQGNWRLIYYGDNNYGLQTEPSSEYLGGAVYICNNRLLLAQSIFDGPDYVFEK